MKHLFVLLAVLIIGISAMAQKVSSHIVERGETLESIAQKYGVTTADIISINPDAAQFIYVGMDLKIPVKTLTVTSTQQQPTSTTNMSNAPTAPTQNSYSGTDYSECSDKDDDQLQWWSAYYSYGFQDGPAKWKSAYGIGWTMQNYYQEQFAWGANMNVMTNVGLVPKDAVTLNFNIGPAFSFFPEPSKTVFLTLPLDLVVTAYYQKNKEKAERGIDSYDTKVRFGFLTSPQINVRLSKVMLTAGVDVSINKKTTASLRVGIGVVI